MAVEQLLSHKREQTMQRTLMTTVGLVHFATSASNRHTPADLCTRRRLAQSRDGLVIVTFPSGVTSKVTRREWIPIEGYKQIRMEKVRRSKEPKENRLNGASLITRGTETPLRPMNVGGPPNFVSSVSRDQLGR